MTEYQPKMIRRYLFAIGAFVHFSVYTLHYGGANPWVIGADVAIVAFWALGAAALVDALKVWKG